MSQNKVVVILVVGLAIGVLQGFLFSRFGVPSFVVTLAGLLAWQGALLQVLGSTGSINLTDPKITGLANTFYSDAVGWIFAAIAADSEFDTAAATQLGVDRAGSEVPLAAVMEAYRVGFRTLWDTVVAESGRVAAVTADVGGNSSATLYSLTGLSITQSSASSSNTIYNQIDATAPFDFIP